MKIGVVGAGYVGLVAGTCLSEMGNSVIIADLNEEVIGTLLGGEVHYYEPGLKPLLQSNIQKGRLSFTTDTAMMVRESKVIFLAVGTPQREDGSANLSYLESASVDVARAMNGPKTIIIKSTVPVGTNKRIGELIAGHTSHEVRIVSNPEFLKEGAAVDDFMGPDRVIVGVRDEASEQTMRSIYDPFMRTSDRLMVMDPESAEMTKYASNAMLACRISFMNEMAKICAEVGADVADVRKGVGSDNRIGSKFLFPGLGYGGSCFPKDVRALAHLAEGVGVEPRILRAVDDVNNLQRYLFLPRVYNEFGENLTGRSFAVWGLAFKPRTDDVREAPALDVIRELVKRGAEVKAYDPEAGSSAGAALKLLGVTEGVEIVAEPYLATEGAEALFICTEWTEFRSPDYDALRDSMSRRIIFDGRNLYEPESIKAEGFTYHCVGRPTVTPD